jgi:putative ABC transport system permease protein
MWRGSWADVRYALRALRATPTMTLGAVLALAIGLAAHTIVFSIVDAALLAPPPFEDPDAIVALGERSPQADSLPVSYPDYADWRGAASVFESIGAQDRETFNLTGSGDPVQVWGFNASASLFEVLKAKPLLGRLFTGDDDRPGAPMVAVLTYRSWMNRFGGDPAIVGRTIVLDKRTRTIVGVLPRDFQYPTAADRGEVYSPFGLVSSDYKDRGVHAMSVVARLKQGVTLDRARGDVDAIAARLALEYPATNRDIRARMDRYHDRFTASARPLLVALWAAVLAVLLVACTSAAALLVARGARRAREFAIRLALGASRARLITQVLTEGLLLAAAGGAVGVLLAWRGLPAIVALLPGDLPHAVDFTLNGPAVSVALASTFAAGLLAGIVPAWQACRMPLYSTSSARTEPIAARPALRAALVVAQLALSQSLLVGAGLLVATLAHLVATDPGFEADRLATGLYYLTDSTYVTYEQLVRFHRAVVARVSALPGVAAAGLITPPPFGTGSSASDIVVEGRDGVIRTDSFRASPTAATALGLPLQTGRFFSEDDTRDRPSVAVVDDRFARAVYGANSPIGRRIRVDRSQAWMTVVGVVGHVAVQSLDAPARPQIYTPLLATTLHFTAIVARTTGDPGAILPAIRRAVRELDPDIPVFNAAPMTALIAATTGRARLGAVVFVAFAGIAWLLAAIGLVGVVGYSVAVRTKELGIRIALGARPDALVRRVIAYGSVLTMIGMALGLAGGIVGARVLSSLLVGVQPIDPVVIGATALALVATGALASYLPARRISRLDPLEALRAD